MRATINGFSFVLSLIALLNLLGVRSEEQSILNSATQSDINMEFQWTWSELALIDGCFKSLYHSSTEGKNEFQIILHEKQRIILVYL